MAKPTPAPRPRTVTKRLPDGTPVRVTIVDTRKKSKHSQKGVKK